MSIPPRHPDSQGPTGDAPRLSRRDELLADRAVQGLSPSEAVELEALGGSEDESWDRAAAALQLGDAASTRASAEAMPAAVHARLLAMGEEWCRNLGRSAQANPSETPALRLRVPPPEPIHAPAPLPVATVRFGQRLVRLGSGVGGWVAAAACLGFAAIVTTRHPGERVVEIPIVREIGEAFKVPVQGYDEFKERGDVVALVTSADDGAEAELVFDPAADRGYLAVAGLDPSQHSDSQYQLWVFDATRAEPYPVNGGIFDVEPVQAGAKIVIPVSTRLPVRNPVAFAVSVEPRGGSVISNEKRLRIPPRLDVGPPEPPPRGDGSSAADFDGHAAP